MVMARKEDCFRQLLLPRRMDFLSLVISFVMKERDDGVDQRGKLQLKKKTDSRWQPSQLP